VASCVALRDYFDASLRRDLNRNISIFGCIGHDARQVI